MIFLSLKKVIKDFLYIAFHYIILYFHYIIITTQVGKNVLNFMTLGSILPKFDVVFSKRNLFSAEDKISNIQHIQKNYISPNSTDPDLSSQLSFTEFKNAAYFE